MRTPIIAGNWKMHKTAAESVAFVNELAQRHPMVTRLTTRLSAPEMTFDPMFRPDPERAQTGALVTRLGNDVIGAQQAFTSVLSSIVSKAITLVLIVAAMAWQQNPTRWCSTGNLVATLKTVEPETVAILNYAAALDQQGLGMVSSAAIVIN